MIGSPPERELAGMVHEKQFPIVLSPCKTFIMLTGFLAMTLLTLGAMQPGKKEDIRVDYVEIP
jgi:hypothetical protein